MLLEMDNAVVLKRKGQDLSGRKRSVEVKVFEGNSCLVLVQVSEAEEVKAVEVFVPETGEGLARSDEISKGKNLTSKEGGLVDEGVA